MFTCQYPALPKYFHHSIRRSDRQLSVVFPLFREKQGGQHKPNAPKEATCKTKAYLSFSHMFVMFIDVRDADLFGP